MGSQTTSHLAGQPGRVGVSIEQTCKTRSDMRYSVLKRQVSKWYITLYTMEDYISYSFVCLPAKQNHQDSYNCYHPDPKYFY